MKNIIDRISKLIDVKSIVTLILVVTLTILTISGRTIPDLFSNSLLLVLGFFFGKNTNSGGDKNV
jgi:hypothetical protein